MTLELSFSPTSSAISHVRYLVKEQQLHLTYTGGSTYCYMHVPSTVAERLYATHLAGGSIGTYILQYVRGAYAYTEQGTNVVAFKKRDTVRVGSSGNEHMPSSLVVSNAYADRLRKTQKANNDLVGRTYIFPKSKDKT